MKDCAYDQCENKFTPATHNQKYCSDVCCRTATNLKVREKYYENKERLKGKIRHCSRKNCENTLSRYNSEKICQECVGKDETAKRNSLLRMMGNVSG